MSLVNFYTLFWSRLYIWTNIFRTELDHNFLVGTFWYWADVYLRSIWETHLQCKPWADIVPVALELILNSLFSYKNHWINKVQSMSLKWKFVRICFICSTHSLKHSKENVLLWFTCCLTIAFPSLMFFLLLPKWTGTGDSWPIPYLCYHMYKYNYRSYSSIYTALVKRNHSVTMVLPMV